MQINFLNILFLLNQTLIIEGPMNIEISYKNNYNDFTFAEDYFKIISDEKDYTIYVEPEINYNYPNFYNAKIFINTRNNMDWTYFLLNIIDDIPPEIKGPDKLTFSSSYSPSINDIFSYYTAYDEIDGICQIYSDDIFDKSTKKITLKAKDKSNNLTQKEIKIFYENENNYWLISNPTLTITNERFLPAYQVVDKLMQEQMLETFSYLYASYNDDTYINNYQLTGMYNISINIFLYNQVEPLTINLSLNIISNETFDEQKEPHWWDSIIDFFKKLFQKIKSIFSI